MTAIETGLQDLRRRHPEWEPWLAVVQEVLSESINPEWDSLVPIRSESQQSKVPLLAGITLTLERRAIHRLLEKLILIAHRSGTPAMASLEPALHRDLDLLSLFKASLCQDRDRLKDIAAYLGADAEAFQAVATLLPVPLLHACNRRWAALKSPSWTEGTVRSAAPGRRFPKCEGSNEADISAAAAAAASGKLEPCSVLTAA